MTVATQAPLRSILDLPDETVSFSHAPAGTATGHGPTRATPDVIAAARDALLAAFDADGQRALLDPFAPAVERNAYVIGALRAAVAADRRRDGPLATLPDDAETLLELFAATLGWGPAQRYLDDPLVNEVKINNGTILVQQSGRPFAVVPERFGTRAEARNRALQLASALGVQLDAAHPQETLPVAHGTRVHVSIHPRIAEPDGALICIRRGRRESWDLKEVLARGTIDEAVSDLLRLLCRARCSFLIAGRTGTGKTAMLEALANSWPDTPHIITIEDHALEIGIRSTDAWTRELVDTQRDPQAFGRAAREALRQTPGLLLPGETRGSEAGAILALALTGHAVITTLHARTAAEAVNRFAGYAAQPGAYLYEGRRDDALRDACAAFDVVVRLDVLDSVGRRFVAELSLLGGITSEGGELRPTLIPLAAARPAPDGEIVWQVFARAENGALVWADGTSQAPPQLLERLAQARAQELASASPTLAATRSAVERAERLIASGDAERALSVLRAAWQERREARLVDIARRAVELAPERFATLRSELLARRLEVDRLVSQCRWHEARGLYERLTADIVAAAVAAPVEGWESLEARILRGVADEAGAVQVCAAAEEALRRGDGRAALDLVNRAGGADTSLSPATALSLLRLRERALEALLASGEGAPEAVEAVRSRRKALESDAARKEGGIE